MWYHATGGKGRKDMVVLPYKDRLLLFSRYLQQLVMESLGKQLDLDGKRVDQGIAVYGNKGSTDQHAYVQQLRDGVNNFFVDVRPGAGRRAARPLEVEPGVTAGDYLHGFLLGTREALFENDRAVDDDHRAAGRCPHGRRPDRAVRARRRLLRARWSNINAYHQPGVEAGKKAAAAVLALQAKVVAALSADPQTAEQIAVAAGSPDEIEAVNSILMHLAANGRAKVSDEIVPEQRTFPLRRLIKSAV